MLAGQPFLRTMGRMRSRSRDAWALLAAALLTGALLAFAVLYQRETTLRAGAQLTDSLSEVIAEQTARTLQSVDEALQLAVARLDLLRVSGQRDPEAGSALLRERLREHPFVRELSVADAQGRVVLASAPGSVGTSVADRPWFQAARRSPATGLTIGPVERGPAGWQLTVARPIRDSGRLREVVVAAIDPSYFEQLWRVLDLGDTGAVVLYHRGGQLLVRSPPDRTLTGQDFSRLPLFTEYLPRGPQGTFVRESSADGVLRVTAYRTLPNYPDLLVAVGSGYDEMLAPWRNFAVLTAAVWAVAVLVVVALTLQLRREARRRAQSEERFQQLAQAMPQIVFTADAKGRVESVNQRWVELTGAPVEHALGSGWQQVVHPEDVRDMVKAVNHTIDTGAELQFEHRLRYRDGSYRWQLLRAVPVRREGGEPLSWFGTATDIDEMKKAQERLRLQAEELRMAGRLTRVGGWRADLETQRVALSEEAAAMLDLPPDAEPMLQDLFSMVAPNSLASGLHALNECLEKGQPFDAEVEMITATGRRVWVRSVGEPIRDAGGRVVGIQGAQQDITLRVLMLQEIRRLNASLEERIAERSSQLARQDALFRTLAEQAPLPFWTLDPQGTVTFLSHAWYELTGGAPPRWQGSEWMDLIHPDDLQAVRSNWRRAAATGEPYAGTRRIRVRDGSYHTTSYRAVPVRDEAGVILFWVGVDTDITELTANEAALRLANRQLESFSYSVSHDLQSPLQRVASYARLLQQELKLVPAGKAQHYLTRIQANADTMAQLIEGLLALAHVSEVDLVRAVVNVSEIATEILLRLQAEQPQRRLRWRVEPGLAVMGDARLMRSVLENLIGNAWKFTGGTPQPEIEVGGSRERGEYFVRDNGCGFDMAYADRLFGTFQRLHSAEEYPGTGIGLATVARAVTRQGGRVWAQAAPGQGATFFLVLPPA
jgi:PAS domain S-box-containing protein